MAKHITGHLFQRKARGAYYVRWAIGGKVFSKALRDDNGEAITEKGAAETARSKFMAPFASGEEAEAMASIAARLDGRKAELAKLEDEKNPPLAIKAAWDQYRKSNKRPDAGESTLRQYEFQFDAFSKWLTENHPEATTLRQVNRDISSQYADHLLASGLSPNTYNKHLNCLELIFRTLAAEARILDNPWRSPKRGGDLTRKRLTPQSRREMTVDELKAVCSAATGELQTLLAVGLYGGLRLGDAATLRWGEVDLRRGFITLTPNKTARSSPEKVVSIPIHSVLRDILAQTPLEKRGEYVMPGTAALYADRIDLVTDRVQAHFEKCGVKTHKPGTGENGKRAVMDVGFHSLRHSFVSICMEAGVPLAVVESLVGHSNPAMTRHYTHIGDVAAEKAIASLPYLLGNSAPAVTPEQKQAATLAKVKSLVKGMTPKNWIARREKILSLLAK